MTGIYDLAQVNAGTCFHTHSQNKHRQNPNTDYISSHYIIFKHNALKSLADPIKHEYAQPNSHYY